MPSGAAQSRWTPFEISGTAGQSSLTTTSLDISYS
jgi:hypothetical protein